MIDACSYIRNLAKSANDQRPLFRLLHCPMMWNRSDGEGVTIGLLDTTLDRNVGDFVGADIRVRDFVDSSASAHPSEHGTHSASLLIGQGNQRFRGIAPRSRLRLANVIGGAGAANSTRVVEALDWLCSSEARVVIIPLGQRAAVDAIARQVEAMSASGIVILAAAGNGYPAPLAFPARHPSVIAVGAANAGGSIVPECSRLPRLDLLAPGERIAAPVCARRVRRRGGSSVACVIAGGVAALLLAAGAVPVTAVHRTSVLNALSRPV